MKYNLAIQIEGDAAEGDENRQSSGTDFAPGHWSHSFPDWELWTVTKTVGPSKFDIEIPGQSHRSVRAIGDAPGEIPNGTVVVVGFYDADRDRPFILAVADLAEEAPEYTPFPTKWIRFGVVKSNFFYLDSLNEVGVYPHDETPEQVKAIAVRSYDEKLHWISGSSLYERDDETGETTETDLGGTAHNLHVSDSGRTYCLVEGSGAGGDATYAEAYAAGYDRATIDEYNVPFFAGSDACTEATGYDPGQAYLDNFFPDDNPAPSPYNDGGTLEGGWFDGLYDGWLTIYDEGYEFEGCTAGA